MTQTKPRENNERHRAQSKAWAFFLLLVVFGPNLQPITFAENSVKRPIVEEMSPEEKTKMVNQLIDEGDRLTKQKDYNVANATYESIFLIDAGNVEASKRIDQLKKIMVKEGVSETQLVTQVYDVEIDIRVKNYLKQAKDLMKQGKLAQARFNLQKLLLINPLHAEANKLYEQVNKKLERAA